MSAPVLTPRTGRLDRLRAPLLVGGGVALATVALHFRDPHRHASWGLCPWYELTGIYCPGCGGLRAVNDLGNGRLVDAASSNLVFVAMVPVLIGAWLLWTRRAWTGAAPSGRRFWTPYTITAMSVVVLCFTVLRNTPAGHWLAP